ncbi:hypothetical protein MJT46_010329 [Ovis ammon polii x Ovis aries]|nr:hypothetical protein MJT46_010329 [Ovis ammon polii x Ovis aries]
MLRRLSDSLTFSQNGKGEDGLHLKLTTPNMIEMSGSQFSYVDLFDCFFSKPMLRKESPVELSRKLSCRCLGPTEQRDLGFSPCSAAGFWTRNRSTKSHNTRSTHKQINGQTSVIVFFIPEVGESSEGLEAGTLMNMPHHKYGCVTEQATYDMELLAALRLLSSQEAGSPEYPVCHHPNNVSE